jgi:hypothetical protein
MVRIPWRALLNPAVDDMAEELQYFHEHSDLR